MDNKGNNKFASSGDKDAEAFLDCIRDSYLYQHVTEFTRTRENSEPSTLDLIFTNEEGMVDDTMITSPLGHSDHCVITFKFRCYFEQINTSTERWNFFKGNYDLMRNEMNIDWDNILVDENSNKLLDIFLDKFNLTKQKSISKINSKKVSKAKKHNYLPLDEQTVKKIRKKTTEHGKRYMETRDGKKYQVYAKLRNHVKNSVKKVKMSMERDIARDVKKNPKKFWKYANSKRKTKSGISELKTNTENGKKITENDRDKAEVLAEFFSSVFTKEPEGEIPNLQPKETTFRGTEHQIEEKEVLKLLLDINPNKSPGPDGIHPKALKETAAILAKPLTKRYNASLQSGIVPDLWKLGNIIASFKKGDNSDPGN
jgi:hypothetical protein